ncbi:hypothetical protein X566_19425 [Afipia sp. P52-10]|jgi:hypothetical protein|uniref:hypothetical protein n=1 Tax=Afipia sp. P52-10 TaxID=1429916 RepID=UPI0003DF1A03|nr:hypothetical protein [Afipia sp. P52-10]ETR74958.1 hypothetical protein X566_19425 [Afipia sp. P52-10]
MYDIVETVLRTYGATDDQSRRRIRRYIETLNSAGQRNPERLAEYGLAYLRELHEGRDRRYSGC